MPDHDGDWFDAIFREHATALTRYFLRRVERDDVDDLAAEVFATAWRRRHDVPHGAELPWLYRTAGYVLANHRRKRRAIPVEDVADNAESPPGGGDPVLSVLADEQMREALAALSPRDRSILLLHAWEGMNGVQLASVLGVSRSGADAALSRARSRLREAWPEVAAG